MNPPPTRPETLLDRLAYAAGRLVGCLAPLIQFGCLAILVLGGGFLLSRACHAIGGAP